MIPQQFSDKEEAEIALENVKEFMIRLASDESLHEQLRGKTADSVVALAAEMGFDFTKDEMKEFGKEIQELAPETLGMVSGGSVDSVANSITSGVESVA